MANASRKRLTSHTWVIQEACELVPWRCHCSRSPQVLGGMDAAPSSHASWMTHVWLVSRLREAFATCAPLAALHRDHGIRTVCDYAFTVHELEPCSKTGM